MSVGLKLYNALDSLADNLNEKTAPAFMDIYEALNELTGEGVFFKEYSDAYELINKEG